MEHTYTVAEENGRYRWTVYRDGRQIMTGTRKREHEAHKEGQGSIRHTEKVLERDRRGYR